MHRHSARIQSHHSIRALLRVWHGAAAVIREVSTVNPNPTKHYHINNDCALTIKIMIPHF
jgi:hypothetical protein